ncbi:uncharacterized protein [Hyperolius riggenbachi]
MRHLLRNLSIVQYKDLDFSDGTISPQERAVKFLEDRGCRVRSKPGGTERGVAPATQTDAASSLEGSSSKMDNHRTPLVCKFCNKLQVQLSGHLHKVCKRNDAAVIPREVEDARERMRELLRKLSIVEYGDLNFAGSGISPRNFMADFLQARGSIVLGRPSDDSSQYNGFTGLQEEEMDEAASTSREESTQDLLQRAGLHTKHFEDSPLLVDFKSHLKGTLAPEVIKHEVTYVAKYLYNMDPSRVSVLFLHCPEQTAKLFQTLATTKASCRKAQRYLRSLKRFVGFLKSKKICSRKDPSLYKASDLFMDMIKKMLCTLSKRDFEKKTTRELKPSNPEECQQVLLREKPYILDLVHRANSGEELLETDLIFFVYYLQALLILHYLHRPAVLHAMTVTQWLERQHINIQVGADSVTVVVIKVNDVASDDQKVAVIVLRKEEEIWFETYFAKIRPIFQSRTDQGGNGFFLSSRGERICKATNYVQQLQRRFSLPVVSGRHAREIFKRCCLSTCSQQEKQQVENYLQNPLVEDDELSMQEAINTAYMITKLLTALVTPASRVEEEDDNDDEDDDDDDSEEDRRKHFKFILDLFPVDINEHGPGVDACQVVSEKHANYFYNKWRRRQYKERLSDIIGHFKRSLPTEVQILEYIKRQRWEINVPTSQDVLLNWKPGKTRGDAKDTGDWKARVKSQDWKGLAIVKDRERGGEKLVATQLFSKGDVVCDCHGILISRARGKEILDEMGSQEMGYILFFKDEHGTRLAIDARTIPCPCHPNIPSTYGRKINHSRKGDNLHPSLKEMDDGTPVILFKAKKDIQPGTELLYNYGVTRMSHGGEAADLLWLDS